MARKNSGTHPLVSSSVDLLGNITEDTGTFTIDSTGELVLSQLAPLPLVHETAVNLGELDLETAERYHLLLVPDHVSPAEIEALAVSVWNEAGWLSPGNLRLQEGCTLEGPWTLTAQTAQSLNLPADVPLTQVFVLRAPARRGSAPLEEIKTFSEWARAFPGGMPVGIEERVLQVLQRMSRRLGGSLRIAGSGHVMTPDPASSVNLRVYASAWMDPGEAMSLIAPHLPGLHEPGPPPSPGAPYALLAPSGTRSQVLIGVRPEQTVPRALRWEMWAKERVFLYEIVWALPEDLYTLDTKPTRAGRLERSRGAKSVETAAALLADALDTPSRGGAAIIDEDGFLVGLDVPPLEEASPHPSPQSESQPDPDPVPQPEPN